MNTILFSNSKFKKFMLFLTFATFFLQCNRKKSPTLYKIYDGKYYGFIDSSGKVVIQPKYKEVGSFQDGVAIVANGIDWFQASYVFINDKGDTMINSKYKLTIDPLDLYPYRKARGLHMKQWFSFMLNEYSFSNGLALIYDDKQMRFGYMNKKGEVALTPSYVNASKFRGGYALVQTSYDTSNWENTHTGLIDSTGKLVIADKYYSLTRMSNNRLIGTFAVKDSLGYSFTSVLLNQNGNVINTINSGFAYFGEFSGSYVPGVDGFWAGLLGTGGFFIVDSTGEILKDSRGGERLYFEDVIINKGKYFWYKRNKKYSWFVLDQNQRINVIDNKIYDTVKAGFNKEGIACVQWTQDGFTQYGYIDTLGNFILNAKFNAASDFNGPLAPASLRKGSIIIDGYINKKGEFVWSREIRENIK
ncbi:MAG: WG repeat-containing protein [Ferruginibacter sp.]